MSQTQNQNQKLRLFHYVGSRASQWNPISGSYLKGSNPMFKYLFFKLTRPFRRWIDPRSANMIPIHVMLFNQPGSRASIHSPVNYHQPNLLSERRFMVEAIPEIGVFTQIFEGYLSTMSIPQDVQADVIQKIYKVFKVAKPGLYIEVIILDVNVNILGKSVLPAPTKSVFHLLDKVSLHALESKYRKKLCKVCCDSLDHVHDAEEGITRLPCNDLFHRGCLAQALELQNPDALVCPICLYPLRTRGSEPSDWLVLLMISAGFLLTRVLLRGLVKRKQQQ